LWAQREAPREADAISFWKTAGAIAEPFAALDPVALQSRP
jgi:hypothetical protein